LNVEEVIRGKYCGITSTNYLQTGFSTLQHLTYCLHGTEIIHIANNRKELVFQDLLFVPKFI